MLFNRVGPVRSPPLFSLSIYIVSLNSPGGTPLDPAAVSPLFT